MQTPESQRFPPLPPMPPTRSVWTGLAVLCPLVVLALALSWLARPLSQEPSKAALRLEKMSARSGQDGPQIVLLGNSLVDMGVDKNQLATALNIEPRRLVHQVVPGSRSATWYAVLKNRVYGQGLTPDLIVVGTTLAWLLDPSLQSALDRQNLTDQLGPEEPVIDQKLFGKSGSWAPIQRIQARRAPLRSGLLNGVRDGVIGRLFPDEDGEAALARVFASDAVEDRGGERRVIPVVELTEQSQRKKAAARLTPEAGFVPELIQLAAEHGARIVFLRMPVPKDRDIDSDISPAEHTALVELVNAAPNALWLDQSDLELGQADFADWIHLSSQGRTKHTRALAAALGGLKVLDGDALPAAELPAAPPTISRSDTLQLGDLRIEPVKGRPCAWMAIPKDGNYRALADNVLLKDGLNARSPLVLHEDGVLLEYQPKHWTIGNEACSGSYAHVGKGLQFSPSSDKNVASLAQHYTAALSPDTPLSVEPEGEAWWVTPGGKLHFALEDNTADQEVLVIGLARGGGQGSAQLELGGHPVPLRSNEDGLLIASLPASSGPLDIGLSSPEGGPFLLLLELGLSGPDGYRSLLGGSAGDRSSLRFFGGTVREGVERRFEAPPVLPQPTAVAHRKLAARINGPAPVLAQLAELRTVLGRYEASPLRVTEDGRVLSGSNKVCADVVEKGEGRICHNDRFVLFSASDGSAALDNGHTYAVALDSERLDRFDLWLYPGDQGSIQLPEAGLREVPWGASRFALSVLAPEGIDGQVGFRLLADGHVVLEEQMHLEGGGQHSSTWRLPAPLSPELDSLDLELHTPADGPYMVVRSIGLARHAQDLVVEPATEE